MPDLAEGIIAADNGVTPVILGIADKALRGKASLIELFDAINALDPDSVRVALFTISLGYVHKAATLRGEDIGQPGYTGSTDTDEKGRST